MKRVALILLAALAVVAVVATVASGDRAADGTDTGGGDYRVRAIFDNAAAAAEGEDVKVAGAKVGTIETLEATPERKAAITIRITDARFTPFHQDARCTLRPEGVLAVKFVECDPGTASRPALARTGDVHVLPVERTSSPVDLDLLNNMMRQPTGRQLAILLSEFGTGLAGRGTELNQVIHRANPALGQTDRVVALLARQSDELARFAADADRALTPLARDRAAVAGFVKQAARTSGATAARSQDIAASIQRLPAFLDGLRGQMAQLQALSAQGVPLLADLQSAAPDLERVTTGLQTAGKVLTPAVQRLGKTARRATPNLNRTLPLIRQLSRLGLVAGPVARDLGALTTSFDDQLGLKHITDLLYFGTNAVNGFDSVGHYARAEPLSGACSEYTAKGFFGCDAQWGPTASSAGPITEPGATPPPAVLTAPVQPTTPAPTPATPAAATRSVTVAPGAAARTASARPSWATAPKTGPASQAALLDYLLGR